MEEVVECVHPGPGLAPVIADVGEVSSEAQVTGPDTPMEAPTAPIRGEPADPVGEVQEV